MFTLPHFKPLPLLRNPHLQTVLGNLLGLSREVPSQLRRVDLPDGDALAIHDSVPQAWRSGDPITVLSHGLGGSHRSAYLQRVARALLAHNVRAIRVNLRGADTGLAWTRRLYNAAAWPDLDAVLAFLHQRDPASPMVLAGFSLSGNIVLNLAAAGSNLAGLVGVAAIAPPIDLERCSTLLATLPFYDRHYAGKLVAQVRQHQRHFPALPPVRFPRNLSLRQFDEIYTAPRGGFADALDYYRRASAKPHLPRIQMPTFILTARDDPFVAADSFDGLPLGPRTELHIVDHGGHLGFLGWDGNGGIRWAERRLVEWIRQQFNLDHGLHG